MSATSRRTPSCGHQSNRSSRTSVFFTALSLLCVFVCCVCVSVSAFCLCCVPWPLVVTHLSRCKVLGPNDPVTTTLVAVTPMVWEPITHVPLVALENWATLRVKESLEFPRKHFQYVTAHTTRKLSKSRQHGGPPFSPNTKESTSVRPTGTWHLQATKMQTQLL